jgi:hypothetical protein
MCPQLQLAWNAIRGVHRGSPGDKSTRRGTSSRSLPQDVSKEDLRIIDDKASQTAEYPQISSQRLAALVDINRQLVSEQDQQQLLKSVCRAARRLLGAKSAALAVGTGADDNDVYFFTSGLSAAVAQRLGLPGLRAGIVGRVFTEREPRRLKLPLDTLKIDRSFVSDMNATPEGMAKLKVVAEGVETDEQSRLLRLLDCDEMQGYLFSKPVTGEIFETRYLASSPIAGSDR